jgi:large subunit ribosomal protein L28
MNSFLMGGVLQFPNILATAANRWVSTSLNLLPKLHTRSASLLTKVTFTSPSIYTPMITTRTISSGRSRRGLYDGKDIRTGNHISFSGKKTRRKFKPNVVIKRVYSETLDKMLRFHMTTATLRSIDKAGGLDNYLLTTRHIGEGEGLVARRCILKKKKKIERERQRLNAENAEVSV